MKQDTNTNITSFTGESGVVYRGYFNTREGKELVAIKSCKRKFYIHKWYGTETCLR